MNCDFIKSFNQGQPIFKSSKKWVWDPLSKVYTTFKFYLNLERWSLKNLVKLIRAYKILVLLFDEFILFLSFILLVCEIRIISIPFSFISFYFIFMREIVIMIVFFFMKFLLRCQGLSVPMRSTSLLVAFVVFVVFGSIFYFILIKK